MGKTAERARVNHMILLFMAAYFVSYITRINYGAIIAEMERATGLAKPVLSLSLTGSFITYGAGQIVSGICGDRFQPKKLVFIGLLTTSAMNSILPFCKDPVWMLAVWCVNGFAQAFMWPPIVRLMAVLFSEEDYKRASVVVSFGSSLGTIAVYLASPFLISWLGWKSVFWVSAGCGILMALIWRKQCCEVPPPSIEIQDSPQGKKASAPLFTPLLLLIMAAIACQGALRDSVTTWMPSYISETYHLSSSVSILTGVILPVFSILSFQAAALLYQKVLRSPLLCACVIFGCGTAAAAVFLLLGGRSVVGSVLVSALLTGCMHGVNLILICMLPPFFKQRGNVSTISGLLNSCTYVGSAVSTYGIAVVSEHAGWQATIVLWLVVAAVGTLICAVCIPGWNRFQKMGR